VQVEAHTNDDRRDVVPLMDIVVNFLILEGFLDWGLSEMKPVLTV
jgi:hypothetical protein